MRTLAPRVCILDYGSGNVRSVYNILLSLGIDTRISNDSKELEGSTHLILPGVGSFGASMEKLQTRISADVLMNEVMQKKKPFLGICVGMQLLAEKGFEFGEHRGLGWITGTVDRIHAPHLPLPHMGWNNLKIVRPSPLMTGLQPDQDFYFVHSFAMRPTEPQMVVATANYGEDFCAIVSHENIHGVQFHPEKSQKAGKLLVKNFLSIS